MTRYLLAAAAAALTAACSGALLPLAPVVAEPPAGAVSYMRDVAPLLTAKCAGCHAPGQPGAVAVAIFDAGGRVQAAEVSAKSARIVASVLAGQMPRNRPRLTAAEAGILQKWSAAGAPTAN